MIDPVLELLVPELRHSSAAGTGAARPLAAALQLARLLGRDGLGPRAATADLDIASAQLEYERRLVAEGLALLGRLFHQQLGPPPQGLPLWTVEPGSVDATWRAVLVLAERAAGLALPSLPEVDESAPSVARRVLLAAECIGLDAGRLGLWRARLAWREGGPGKAEAGFARVLAGPGLGVRERSAAVLGVAACRLERCAPVALGDWTEQHLDLAASSPLLLQLAGWAALAVGDLATAEEYLTPVPSERLPSAMAALAARRPELRRLLVPSAGSERAQAARPVAGPCRVPRDPIAGDRSAPARADIGAAALVVLVADETGVRALHAQLAAGLGQLPEAWLDRQQAAPFERGEPERRLLSEGCRVVAFPGSDELAERRLLRGCLSTRCRALALVPLPGCDSVAERAWVRLEFEHLLVPSDERLTAFAAGLARRLGWGQRRAPDRGTSVLPSESALAASLAPLLEGIGLGRRRWWLLDRDADEVLATDGRALGDWRRRRGAGLALERSRRSGLPVCLAADSPDAAGAPVQPGDSPGAGFHAGARSGLVLPLTIGPAGRAACGWLVLESTRRADLGQRELATLEERAASAGARLAGAHFAAWHAASWQQAIHVDCEPPTPAPVGLELAPTRGLAGASLLHSLAARTAAGEPTFLSGPSGSGKTVCSRWVHHLAGGSRATRARWTRVSVRDLSDRDWRGLLAPRATETLVLTDLESLLPGRESCLLELIDRQLAAREGLLVLTGLAAADTWGPRLGALMASAEVPMAALTERRRELPGIFEALLARAARLERRLPPELTDRARALIWRQDWPGGLRQVEGFARRVVIAHSGEEVAGSALMELAASTGQPLLRRVPSKSPDLGILWAALAETRKKGGSFHRGRAAELLGWDPDTLTARLRELDLAD